MLRLVSIFRVPCSTPKNVGKTAAPSLQEPFLHDFLQEKNILRGLQNRVYAGPFTLVELSFATVVREQISRQFCVPFCLKRGGFFEGAKLFGRIWPETLEPRLACESQRYGGRRRCAQTPCVPVVETSKRPGQRIQTANDRRPASRSSPPQRVGRKAGRDFREP